nr:hypothetical protein [Tanacetum cinerariifolium]
MTQHITLADEIVDATPPRALSTSMASRIVQRRAMHVLALANPSSKDKEVMVSPPCGLKTRRYKSLGGGPSPVVMGRRIGFRGPLASSHEIKEIDPFLPWDDKAQVSHGILSGLPHLKTQRHLDGLTLIEIANFRDVSALKFVMSNSMLNREAQSLFKEATSRGTEGRLAAMEDSIVCDLKAENKKLEKDVVILATKASLKAELEVIKEKLDFANEDRSLMVTDLLSHALVVTDLLPHALVIQ